MSGLASLKTFVKSAPVADLCGLCATPLGEPHPHLFDRTQETLACACPACAMLFDSDQAGRWRRVPQKSERLASSPIDDATWAALGLPIGLAFFVNSSRENRVVAWYPGPMGAARCQLSFTLPTFDLAQDVEALLINRLNGANDAWRLSLDGCFALVGRIRSHWRGFSGGPAVREAVTEFLAHA